MKHDLITRYERAVKIMDLSQQTCYEEDKFCWDLHVIIFFDFPEKKKNHHRAVLYLFIGSTTRVTDEKVTKKILFHYENVPVLISLQLHGQNCLIVLRNSTLSILFYQI